jgi:hypothetical protein
MSSEEWEAAAALREGRAEYVEGGAEGGAGRPYIYKVWNEGEGRNLRFERWAATVHDHKSAEAAGVMQDGEATPLASPSRAGCTIQDDAKENEVRQIAEEASARDTGKAQTSDKPVKGHACVFAVSFTESARFGTLWSVRIVHGETNYFALMRLMQKIEKRRAAGEPLAANAPHPPRKRERTRAGRIAFRYGIEEEDVYSIKYSTETVPRLAVFYGIPERDVRRIQAEEVEENNSDNRFDE